MLKASVRYKELKIYFRDGQEKAQNSGNFGILKFDTV